MNTKLTPFVFGAALVAVAGSATLAEAERRKNSLPGDVAVRHRRLLVKNRFEVAPLFESTMNAEFQHIIGGGLKLEYHLSDMLSIGGLVVGSTVLKTKLTERITAGKLKIHGALFAIADGVLHVLDEKTGEFAPASRSER